MILTAIGIACIVLLALLFMPVKKKEAARQEIREAIGLPASALPTSDFNIRKQQLEEEAAAISEIYLAKAREKWLAEVQEKAATMLGSGE